jgi:hypothetical protein
MAFKGITHGAARNLKGCHHSLTLLKALDTGAHLVNSATELMAKDVPFLQLYDCAYL